MSIRSSQTVAGSRLLAIFPAAQGIFPAGCASKLEKSPAGLSPGCDPIRNLVTFAHARPGGVGKRDDMAKVRRTCFVALSLVAAGRAPAIRKQRAPVPEPSGCAVNPLDTRPDSREYDPGCAVGAPHHVLLARKGC